MNELSIEEFTKFVIGIMQEHFPYEITLENPDDRLPFPLSLVSNPMSSIIRVEQNQPIFTRFSITIEWWANKKYDAMRLFDETNRLLRDYNFLMVGKSIDLYDENTQKHRFGDKYEVYFNGLTNSLDRIK